MTNLPRIRAVLVGGTLSAIGLAALAGLVSPVASNYLDVSSLTGDAAISKTTPSLVRVHLTPPDTARLSVMRNGKSATLLFELDPDCPPPSGWV
jgi:hypothetical protein